VILATLLVPMALAVETQGALNVDATALVSARPGAAVTVDYGLWKGLWVGARVSSQQEAYGVGANLGEFTERGTWYHGLLAGIGWRFVLGAHDRWDLDLGFTYGTEFTFVRETIAYPNSGTGYTVHDERSYQSWVGGVPIFPPTLRYHFGAHHGIMLQGVIPIPLSSIERVYIGVGYTSRWGLGKKGD